jgi:hypothetical protein
MRNIHDREREKTIMHRPELPFNPMDPERELRASELEERRIKRDFNTSIPVLYIVASIAVVLILIVAILGVDVFHFW